MTEFHQGVAVDAERAGATSYACPAPVAAVATCSIDIRLAKEPHGWRAQVDHPVALVVTESSYRRACGKARRALELLTDQRVYLHEYIAHPENVAERLARFRASCDGLAALTCSLREDARFLVAALKRDLPLSIIARELGVGPARLRALLLPRATGR